jgi:hypothetical protein
MAASVMLSIANLAVEFHGQPTAMDTACSIVNNFFGLVFALEAGMKIYALGPPRYFMDRTNTFDAIVTFCGLLEWGTSAASLVALRSFRLLRILTMLQRFPTLKKQLAVMKNALGKVVPFLLLLALFLFMTTVLAMHLFGNLYVQTPCLAPGRCLPRLSPQLLCHAQSAIGQQQLQRRRSSLLSFLRHGVSCLLPGKASARGLSGPNFAVPRPTSLWPAVLLSRCLQRKNGTQSSIKP